MKRKRLKFASGLPTTKRAARPAPPTALLTTRRISCSPPERDASACCAERRALIGGSRGAWCVAPVSFRTFSTERRGVATQTKPADDSRDVELLDQLARARRALVEQIGRRIIGQHKIVDDLVAALLAGGHALIVGVPGLAKTLLVQTVSQALDRTFSR